MIDKAILPLTQDVFIGSGKKAVLFGKKSDRVEVSKRDDGLYLARNVKTNEKLIISKDKIGL